MKNQYEKPIHLNQMKLCSDIMAALEDNLKVLDLETNVLHRHMNACIEAANVICAEFARPYLPVLPGMGVWKWVMCDETGLSSRWMAAVCFGGPRAKNHYPADAADFGRCEGLIVAMGREPTLVEWARLANSSPEWGALVARWGEIRAAEPALKNRLIAEITRSKSSSNP